MHNEPVQSNMNLLCDCNICITFTGKPVMLSNMELCRAVFMMTAALAYVHDIAQYLYMCFFMFIMDPSTCCLSLFLV